MDSKESIMVMLLSENLQELGEVRGHDPHGGQKLRGMPSGKLLHKMRGIEVLYQL